MRNIDVDVSRLSVFEEGSTHVTCCLPLHYRCYTGLGCRGSLEAKCQPPFET
jgi:hypothetical protein